MQNPLSLSELNQLIRQTLDSNLAPSYWVIAEIGELRDSVKGHAYLELVEKSGDRLVAKIKANIWSYTYQGIRSRFNSTTGQNIRNGMKVLALVNVQFHEIYGLSINIKDIDPNYTIGESAKRKQEIIDRLTREGLIHLNKQYVLPQVPQRLAVISSPTAAGFEDFINQLETNSQGFRVHWDLYQASMQGKEAASSIINAIQSIEADLQRKDFDLLVIIRGGGAKTDMDCFDDYELAKAISNTSLPVVTGIGHERDECIADMVANTKMKTPTAVAEFILSGFRDFEEKLLEKLKKIERTAGFFLQREDRLIRDKEHMLRNLFVGKVASAKEKLSSQSQEILSLAKNTINLHNMSLINADNFVRKNTKIRMERESSHLMALEKDLGRLNPHFFLQRGYTRTEINGIPVNQAEVQIGHELTTFTLTKKIKSQIEHIDSYEH